MYGGSDLINKCRLITECAQHFQKCAVFAWKNSNVKRDYPYKRKCGKKIGNIPTPEAATYHEPTVMRLFMIGHSFGSMGGQRRRAG